MLGFTWFKSAATTIASIEMHQSPMLLERLLTWRSLTYSIKCFAAAMLALFVAFSLGLDWPYWAMPAITVSFNLAPDAALIEPIGRDPETRWCSPRSTSVFAYLSIRTFRP
jgi:hypothetical protein